MTRENEITLNKKIEQARSLLSDSRKTVALTGAGISTPSGIPDFRSPNSGLWEKTNPFEVASIYSFRHRPEDFYAWIHPIANKTITAEPNPAHYALALLEENGPLIGLITQNVDMLHEKAGSKVIHEIHGNFRKLTCINCYQQYSAEPYLHRFILSGETPTCPACDGVLKPNVILIGEQLPVKVLNEANKQISNADLLLVVGSSLEMAPACNMPELALANGARMIIINLSETHMDQHADLVIQADVVDVLPRLAEVFSG